VITTRGLTKRFGSVLAVDGVDLDVRDGDIYGFLGANGSGKTTTVRMLLGLVLATAGEISVLDQPMPKAARRVLPRVGALVEAPAAYGHMSGRANLMLFDAAGPGRSRRTRAARVDKALTTVGLGDVGRRPVKAYSLGMRQRLGLAAALLADADLLILDEPTNGLDPQGIREVRELILELHSRGRRSSSPATCWPRSSRCVPESVCSIAAAWCCRTIWTPCASRPVVLSSAPPTPPRRWPCSTDAWNCATATGWSSGGATPRA
jgi:ABC-type multidrug transport system ATPase subunit